MNRIRRLKPPFWIAAIFALGFAYLLALQAVVADGVFFNGDSGLKALISQNIAEGHAGFDLDLAEPPWIHPLWEDGLFPYEEPFVYHLEGKYYITFPYTFSLVTAPFYAAFGYRGLYVVPFLATLLIWLAFYRLCRKLGYGAAASGAALFGLIFASNLSLFSATYWEHTLSVCLAFGGLALLFPARGGGDIPAEQTPAWAIAAAGALTGLAVWFRPEQIFLVIFLCAVALYGIASGMGKGRMALPDLGSLPRALGRRGWVYIASAAAALLLYGGSNWLIYHNFFGVHAIQVLEHRALAERAQVFLQHIRQMTVGDTSFFLFNPLSLFVAGYFLLSLARLARLARHERGWTLWYLFFPAFLLGVAALVPPGAGGKQWGPRFLLLLAPLTALLFAGQVDALLKDAAGLPRATKVAALAAAALLAAAGIVQDPVRGRDYLAYNYNLVKPAAENLRAEHPALIAISNRYLSQVFQPALGHEAVFVFVETEQEMARLDRALLDQGRDTFTYVCYSFDCKLFEGRHPGGTTYSIETVTVADYGKYTVRTLRVSPSR